MSPEQSSAEISRFWAVQEEDDVEDLAAHSPKSKAEVGELTSLGQPGSAGVSHPRMEGLGV